MHKERLSPSTTNNNFHTENFNQNGGNFTKHHQFLFPSHIYKRLFDTSIFPKTQSLTALTAPTAIIANTNSGNMDNKSTAITTSSSTAISSSRSASPATASGTSVHSIPRNLLFSCTDEGGKSDDEDRNKENEEVRLILILFLFLEFHSSLV